MVTGHHSGDAAESVLLALLRGSGLDGAAGMPRRRPLGDRVSLVRPLLTIDPRRLRMFVTELGLPVSHDETNADLRLRRNAVRGLLEALERIAPGARRNIARAANLLRSDRMLLRNSERQAWQRSKRDGAASLAARELRRLPAPLLRRVIRRAVREQTGGARDFSLRQCNAIARAIRAGRGGSYQAGRAVVQLSAGTLSVEPISTPRSRSHPADLAATIVPVEKNASIATPWGALTLRVAHGSASGGARSADTLRLDYSQLRQATVSVRLPRPGDRCIPSGRRSLTSLARFLAKAGVAKGRRPLTPLLCVENRIAAALPFRVMEPYVPRAGAAVLEVRWSPSG